MPEIFVGGTKYEDPRDLLDEYVTRLTCCWSRKRTWR